MDVACQSKPLTRNINWFMQNMKLSRKKMLAK